MIFKLLLLLILADVLRPFANHLTEDLFSQSFTMMGFEFDDSLKTYNPGKASHRSGKKKSLYPFIIMTNKCMTSDIYCMSVLI